MSITAKVIADSIYDGGPRLTTMVLRMPRIILAEFNTHRVFSRNASSSRAIPVQKMIDQVMNDPFMPTFWGKSRPGMAATEEVAGQNLDMCKTEWLFARDNAVTSARMMLDNGLHKQIANRILEPWMYTEVVVTATDWANFYALRTDTAAQPEMRVLAETALVAHNESKSKTLTPGEWHLPFLEDEEKCEDIFSRFSRITLCCMSAARCARVSYLNHEGKKTTFEEDMALYERLMGGEVKHSSPTEHQARAPVMEDYDYGEGVNNLSPSLKSNLYGWVQFRKTIKNENISNFKEFTR